MESGLDPDGNRGQFSQHPYHPSLDREVASCCSARPASICPRVRRKVGKCSDAPAPGCRSESRQILSRFLVQHGLATSGFHRAGILNWSTILAASRRDCSSGSPAIPSSASSSASKGPRQWLRNRSASAAVRAQVTPGSSWDERTGSQYQCEAPDLEQSRGGHGCGTFGSTPLGVRPRIPYFFAIHLGFGD